MLNKNILFLNSFKSLWSYHNIPMISWSFFPILLAIILGCCFFFQIMFWFDFFYAFCYPFQYIIVTFFDWWLYHAYIWVLFIIYSWFYDFIWELSYSGEYLVWYRNALKGAFILFLISEIFFFFGLFWAFFHASLHSTMFIGELWPPKGILIISPITWPFFNTLLLLCSGSLLSNAILALYEANKKLVNIYLCLTIVCGILFTYIQYVEYINCLITINTSIFGSIFFFATGTHGLHVLLGTLFLSIIFFQNLFTNVGILVPTLGAWYWHFVDIIWIFLYIFIYCWGSIY